MKLLLDIVLAGLVVLSVSLQKTYSALPAKEVKRRARAGDEIAKLLHKAVSYGHSLRAVLWALIIVFSALFFFMIAHSAPTWFAITAGAALLWLAYVWIPSGRVTRIGERLAIWLAPPIAWTLNYLHPFLDRLIRFIHRHRPVTIHTGLYEKQDLMHLLTRQQLQADNRIDQNALEIAKHALTFSDQLVRDHLVPKRVIKGVSVDETIGPVLMTELHDSGHSRFPVYDGKKENIVGTLYLRDLVSAKSTGIVKDIMKRDVCYVHEQQSLYDALQAILKTRHHMLVVVNSFEEYIGIITMEDVLEQIIGKPIIDEFDQYNDLRAVAAREAKVEHKANDHAEKTTTTKENVTITSDKSKDK
ncbi:MAG TPA: CBS domain-containing protein [Candidatus Saccharimonadales bacterium]|nr:CBS domain-containing protein [Candidatus Saccharimonadales bacterium]